MSLLILDLQKGDPTLVLDLEKEAPDLTILRGEIAWSPHPSFPEDKEKGFDIDIFLIATDANGKVTSLDHITYFKKPFTDNNALSVPNDNRVGGLELPEIFEAKLKEVSLSRQNIEVYAFIHKGAERQQNFGMIANAHFDLFDGVTGNKLRQYNLSQDYSSNTVVHIATIARVGSGWEFRPQGVGGNLTEQQVLNAYSS
jgi:tellurite resistance protein TerA